MSSQAPALSPASIVVQCPDQVAATIDEVTAIMSLDRGLYYLLDATGSTVWTSLAAPTRVSDLCAALVKQFEVDPETCERDVMAFIDGLLTRGLARLEG